MNTISDEGLTVHVPFGLPENLKAEWLYTCFLWADMHRGLIMQRQAIQTNKNISKQYKYQSEWYLGEATKCNGILLMNYSLGG